MILTGKEILRQTRSGRVIIDPFNTDCLNPNSYDVALGLELLRYTSPVLDPRVANPVERLVIPPEGLLLRGGSFYLGGTVERIGSDNYVPMLHAKSGIARLGMFVHVTADLIDIGSVGNLTLQLHPVLDLKVYAGMRVAQVSFWVPNGPIDLYEGKYQGSAGPQRSQSYMDEVLDIGG